jgi:hypothetical protein
VIGKVIISIWTYDPVETTVVDRLDDYFYQCSLSYIGDKNENDKHAILRDEREAVANSLLHGNNVSARAHGQRERRQSNAVQIVPCSTSEAISLNIRKATMRKTVLPHWMSVRQK